MKEPIKETFEITKETIIKYKMKDEFPEVFKVKLEVGKWYKNMTKDGIYFCFVFLELMEIKLLMDLMH